MPVAGTARPTPGWAEGTAHQEPSHGLYLPSQGNDGLSRVSWCGYSLATPSHLRSVVTPPPRSPKAQGRAPRALLVASQPPASLPRRSSALGCRRVLGARSCAQPPPVASAASSRETGPSGFGPAFGAAFVPNRMRRCWGHVVSAGTEPRPPRHGAVRGQQDVVAGPGPSWWLRSLQTSCR